MHFTIYDTFFTESSPPLLVPVFQILHVFGEYFMYGRPVLLISRKWRVSGTIVVYVHLSLTKKHWAILTIRKENILIVMTPYKLQSIGNNFRTEYTVLSWDNAPGKAMPRILYSLEPEDRCTWKSNSYETVTQV